VSRQATRAGRPARDSAPPQAAEAEQKPCFRRNRQIKIAGRNFYLESE
jgi:hypothetical protein